MISKRMVLKPKSLCASTLRSFSEIIGHHRLVRTSAEGSLVSTFEGTKVHLHIVKYQKRPFVHNSVCSQFLEGLFAIF